jgi:hypothetical protein
MNGQIQKLIKQATTIHYSGPGEIQELDPEKFAELIVRECCQALWTEECHTSDLALEEFKRNTARIRQQLGVEE